MASLNRTTLIGNLGDHPEIRCLPDGTPTVTISMATKETWKDKDSGEKKQRTEWHRVVFFGKLAVIVGECVRKGSQIYVDGRLRTRKWVDKNNIVRYTTEIIVREMQMLGKKVDNEAEGAPEEDGPPQEDEPHTDYGAPEDFDDGIPF